MEHNVDTPPQSLSRASTVVVENHEREARKTPSTHSSRSSDVEVIQVKHLVNTEIKSESAAFEPHKMLMQTTISIEYGADLSGRLTVHEELLRCYSKDFEQLCAKAQHIREQYAQAKVHMDQIARFVFPEVTARQFEEQCMEKRVIPMVLNAHDRYPLLEARSSIKKVVETSIDEQLGRKNTKAPVLSGKKREYREMSSDASIRERLLLLNSRGVHEVTGLLYARMHKVHKAETAKAKTDRVKAIAQSRIIMPDAEESTVRFFVQWLYHSTIHCLDAKQLYALWNFSSHLGTEALSDLCLMELYNAAYERIQRALADGVSVSSLLLRNSSDTADNVVDTVFVNVLKDENPPGRLLRLVIDTLADNVDMNLWGYLKDMISHQKAIQLIEAMILRQRVHAKNANHMGVKSENGANFDNRSDLDGNKQDPVYAE